MYFNKGELKIGSNLKETIEEINDITKEIQKIELFLSSLNDNTPFSFDAISECYIEIRTEGSKVPFSATLKGTEIVHDFLDASQQALKDLLDKKYKDLNKALKFSLEYKNEKQAK